MMDSETGRSKGYGFISVIQASALLKCFISLDLALTLKQISLQMQNVQKKLWSS